MECSLTKLKRGGKGRPKAEVRRIFGEQTVHPSEALH